MIKKALFILVTAALLVVPSTKEETPLAALKDPTTFDRAMENLMEIQKDMLEQAVYAGKAFGDYVYKQREQ